MMLIFAALFWGALINLGKADDNVATCLTSSSFNYFNVSEMTKFQTPNYPKTINPNNNTILNCNANFVAKNSGDYLWITFINGAIMQFTLSENSSFPNMFVDFESNYAITTFVSYSGNLNFQILSQFSQQNAWTAFDAVVVPFSPSSILDCPLNKQNFNLDNGTSIPITSDYGVYRNATSNCTWTFSVEPGYQLKLLIKRLTPNYELTILGDSTLYAFPLNVDPYNPQVVYLNGSQFTISLNVNGTPNTVSEFYAIVSEVSEDTDYTEQCSITSSSGGTTVISNMDFINGYSPYTSCTYPITMPAGYEGLLEFSYDLFIEAGADKLTLTYPDGKNLSALEGGSYKIKQSLNGSTFQFLADGNTQQAGFQATYKTYKCDCAPSNYVIPCSNETSTLTPLPNGIRSFCDHQDCNFTITLEENCAWDYFLLQTIIEFQADAWMAFYINGSMSKNYTHGEPAELQPYGRSTNITVVFHSGQSQTPVIPGDARWLINTQAVATPPTKRIDLTAAVPTYAIWLDNMVADQEVTVCSPDNDLELFITDGVSLGLFDLYDSDGLHNYTDTLGSQNFPYVSNSTQLRHVMSESGCFTIYNSLTPSYVSATAFFRMKNAHIKNCNNAENVVRLDSGFYPQTFTIGATAGGQCEMIIFAKEYNLNPTFLLNNFQTTSTSAVFNFGSTVNKLPYFDMPANEINMWNNNVLYSGALSIVAPASSSLTFNASMGDAQIYDQQGPFKGVAVSPMYSGINLTNLYLADRVYAFIFNNTRTANFVVRDLAPGASVVIQNVDQGENHTLSANESYIANGTKFNIISSVKTGNNAFRIEYGFDVLVSETLSTTASSSSTSAASQPSTSPTTPKTNDAIKSVSLNGFVFVFSVFVFAFLQVY